VIEGIVVTVVGGLILAAILALLSCRKRLLEWLRQQRAEIAGFDQQHDAERLKVLREQVVEVARRAGEVTPVSSSGVNPTAVKFSDGTTSYYFADHASYARAMQGGQVPPTRSFRAAAPAPVSRWSRDRLEQWLNDHADSEWTGES